MTDVLRERRERSQKRKQLLAQTFGVSNVDELRQALGTSIEPKPKKIPKEEKQVEENVQEKVVTEDSTTDELVYTDSSTFLKGTQSSNPHNDYCQHFVDTGQRPQNFIRDVGLADRFEEYPKLRELIKLKDDLIAKTASPPMYLKTDLQTFDMKELNSKFDVILVEPPLEEYQRTMGVTNMQFWGWDQIMQLDVGEVAAARSFVFLWCGSSEGLDMGRVCLRKWGFRRCEDICWIRTNINNPSHSKNLEPKAVFQRTKEHCLMGIKGTVRRSTDGDFIHANVDIDLIISEEPEYGSLEKPVEIFHIIEHFCLGSRSDAVCRQRYHFMKQQHRKQFCKEIRRMEMLQSTALDGVRLHMVFCNCFSYPERKKVVSPLSSKERLRVEDILKQRKGFFY